MRVDADRFAAALVQPDGRIQLQHSGEIIPLDPTDYIADLSLAEYRVIRAASTCTELETVLCWRQTPSTLPVLQLLVRQLRADLGVGGDRVP